jgi:hypothetical protein
MWGLDHSGTLSIIIEKAVTQNEHKTNERKKRRTTDPPHSHGKSVVSLQASISISLSISITHGGIVAATATGIALVFRRLDVQDVVASDQYFPQKTS